MNLYQRIAEAMKECTYVQKDTKVRGFGAGGTYRAVSHDAVTAKVRSALLAHGVIAPVTVLESSEQREELPKKDGGVRVVFRCTVRTRTDFINIDDPKETLHVESIGTGEDSGDKAAGKAVSYAAKYALLKTLMLETGDDADKDASLARPSKAEQVDAQKKELYAKLNDEQKASMLALCKGRTAEEQIQIMREALGEE